MKKKIANKVGMWLILLVLSLTAFCQNTIVSEAVTPSSTDYRVLLNGSRFFVHNKKTVGSEIGTEYYMTYTVEKVNKNPTQQGVLGTADATRNFPYEEGGFLRFSKKDPFMVEEGASYFIKFTVAEGGFIYKVVRAKGDQIEQLAFDNYAGTAKDKMGYFGLWLAYGGVDVIFKDVRFYDANGNDLGVEVDRSSAFVTQPGFKQSKATDVPQRYEITITDRTNIAISNLKPTTSSKIFIEYKVAEAGYQLNQYGVSMSNEPTSDYPHRFGAINFESLKEAQKEIDLLELGAEYIITIVRGERGFDVIVQKTKDNQTTTFLIGGLTGTYEDDFGFVSLWYGSGGSTRASFKLEDFKIYDAKHNSLGVQTNVNGIIINRGELEDYSGSEAVYYCRENSNFIALYKDQNMKHTVNGVTVDATYKIVDNVMKAVYTDEVKEYEYLYKRITDSEKNVYERLYSYQVNFVTGSDAEIPTQILSNETGYQAMCPEDPKMKGYEFEGWYTSDGDEFDFKQIVTESVTLYAKWSGDGGITFVASEEQTPATNMVFFVGIGAATLVAGIAVCVLLIRKGLKNDKNKK